MKNTIELNRSIIILLLSNIIEFVKRRTFLISYLANGPGELADFLDIQLRFFMEIQRFTIHRFTGWPAVRIGPINSMG